MVLSAAGCHDDLRGLPAQGDKVKLTITFKGREMQFQDIGRDLFKVCQTPVALLGRHVILTPSGAPGACLCCDSMSHTCSVVLACCHGQGFLLRGCCCVQKFVDDLQSALEEDAKVEGNKDAVQATVQQDAKMQGNQMTLLLSPLTKK